MMSTMSTFILATGGYDPSVRFYDATTQSLIRTLPFPDQHVLRLAFSGKGPVAADEPLYIMVGGAPTICVYDITTNDTSPHIFQPYTGHTEAVTAVGFEPKHSAFVYSASEDGTLHTWLPEYNHNPAAQAYLGFPQYTIPAVSGNGINPYMHAERPGILGQHRLDDEPFVPAKFENRGPVGMVAIHDAIYYPDEDLFFTVDALGRVRAWDRKGSEKTPRCEAIPHHSRRNLQCVELSADCTTLLTANFDGLVFVYNVKELLDNSNVTPVSFRANSCYITRIRLSASGNLLACTTKSQSTKVFQMSDVMSGNGTVDTSEQSQDETVTPRWDFAEHPGWVWDVSFVGELEDYLFTCSSNMRIMLWDLNNVRRSSQYKCHQKPVVCLAVKERWKTGVTVDQLTMDQATANQSHVPSQGEFNFFPGFKRFDDGGHSDDTSTTGGAHHDVNDVGAEKA